MKPEVRRRQWTWEVAGKVHEMVEVSFGDGGAQNSAKFKLTHGVFYVSRSGMKIQLVDRGTAFVVDTQATFSVDRFGIAGSSPKDDLIGYWTDLDFLESIEAIGSKRPKKYKHTTEDRPKAKERVPEVLSIDD